MKNSVLNTFYGDIANNLYGTSKNEETFDSANARRQKHISGQCCGNCVHQEHIESTGQRTCSHKLSEYFFILKTDYCKYYKRSKNEN